MDRLIIFRHGKAEAGSQSGSDFDRALTERGRADAEAMGRLLAVTGCTPDLALVSSAVRAVQTLEAARRAFPKVEVKVSGALYLSGAAQLMGAAQAEAAATVLLVAHNPGLHELALSLARRGEGREGDLSRLEAGFPPSAVAVFTLEAGVARLAAFHTPRD